jgi:hypothetical protein
VSFAFEWLHQASKRILDEFINIVEDPFTAIRRDRAKLFCGFPVNVYDPGHGGVGPE